jgi:hypothetical protein
MTYEIEVTIPLVGDVDRARAFYTEKAGRTPRTADAETFLTEAVDIGRPSRTR